MTNFNKKVIFNSFIKGQFIYFPLLWMLSIRNVNHKINRLHEGGLGALLNDETSAFNDMLSKSNDTAFHVNPFFPNAPFFYPMKTSEKLLKN